jgi:hypothetical protein
MEARDIIIGLTGLVTTGLGWWVSVVWAKLEKTKDELNDLKVQIARDVVTYESLREMLETLLEPIKSELEKIDRKLDGKADK